MPQLAIFDIDGTLTDTNAVDDQCFLQAVADVFEIPLARLDWSGAPHVTDAAIAHWLCEIHCGRPPAESEIERLLERFLELLRSEHARSPQRFAPIAGAPGLFPALRSEGWEVAVATGGWGPSAQFKLRASGLDEVGLVLACASDAHSRETIVQLARNRALARGQQDYTRIVSIGDGVWDVRCAVVLQLPFVGIGSGARADELRAAGATIVLSDLSDRDALCEALATAHIPRPNGTSSSAA